MKGDLFADLAASLERARFDYLLAEDTSMIEDAYGRSMETTLKYGMLALKCDPVPLIPLLTQRTKHSGFTPGAAPGRVRRRGSAAHGAASGAGWAAFDKARIAGSVRASEQPRSSHTGKTGA